MDWILIYGFSLEELYVLWFCFGKFFKIVIICRKLLLWNLLVYYLVILKSCLGYDIFLFDGSGG